MGGMEQGRGWGWCRSWLLSGTAAFALALAACGGGGGGGGGGDSFNGPAPPDLSGVWAGTWSGTDPFVGSVNGNWEADLSQDGTEVEGPMILSGDVDCPDGSVTGSADTVNNLVTGALFRLPCQHNEWVLTALNLDQRSASGAWTQPESGATGTFTGTQVAKPDGPRIAFFTPPGGLPGTVVTIVGSRFASTGTENVLNFGETPAVVAAADAATLVTRAPPGEATVPLTLSTSDGTAISPRLFNFNVTSPDAFLTNKIGVGLQPEGVAISPDGRKAFVANREDGTISMIDTANNLVIATTAIDAAVAVPVQGIAVSPDGRRLYVASGDRGVSILHAGTNRMIGSIPAPVEGGTQPNPQGIAVSPDGRLLYVADHRDGGAFTLLDIATRQTVASVSLGPDTFPTGVAPGPDGLQAFMAFSAASGPGTLVVFDLPSRSVSRSIPVGPDPVGVAVSPDGGRSASLIDSATRSPCSTPPPANWSRRSLSTASRPASPSVPTDGGPSSPTGGAIRSASSTWTPACSSRPFPSDSGR
jgi:YVTN family beta-propeller protein